MSTKQVAALIVALMTLALSEVSWGQMENAEMFIGKEDAHWEYSVRWGNGQTGTLSIINAGKSDKSHGLSGAINIWWLFKPTGGAPTRLTFLYHDTPGGLALAGMNARVNEQLVESQSLDPMMVALKFPLQEEQWRYQGFQTTKEGVRRPFNATNVVRRARVQVPAGVFDAFELQGTESTGARTVEYWVKNVGLVKVTQTPPSGDGMSAELVRYYPAGQASSQVMVMARTAPEGMQNIAVRPQKLTRTIEGFTLGMPLRDAAALFINGIHEERFDPRPFPFGSDVMNPEFAKHMIFSPTLLGGNGLPPFATHEAESVVIRCYQGRVSQIRVKFRADADVLKSAFVKKYGPGQRISVSNDSYVIRWEDTDTLVEITPTNEVWYTNKASLKLEEQLKVEAELQQKSPPKNF